MVKFMGLGLIIFLPLWIISIWQLDKAGFGKRMVGLVSTLTVIMIVLFPFLMTRRGLVDTIAVNLILIAAAGLLFLVGRSFFEEERYREAQGEGGEREEFIVSKLLKQAGFTANPDEIAAQGAGVQTAAFDKPPSTEQHVIEARAQTLGGTPVQEKHAPVLDQHDFSPREESVEPAPQEADDLGKLLAALDEEEVRRESGVSRELEDAGESRVEEIEPGIGSVEEIEIEVAEDFELEEGYGTGQEAETVEFILDEEAPEEAAVEELIDEEPWLEEEPAREVIEEEAGIEEEAEAVPAEEEIEEEVTAEREATEEEAAEEEAAEEEAEAVPAEEEIEEEVTAEIEATEEEVAEEEAAEEEAAEEEAEAGPVQVEGERVPAARAEGIEAPSVAPVVKAESREEEKESVSDDEERKEQIAHYIDIGFEAKEQGDTKQAILEFLRALDAGPEPQLILLLGIEVSQLYAQQGNYDDAIGILERIKPEICKEKRVRVQRELNYLQALKKLLDQAGLSGMPAPRVPRFYKMRAEEIARSK